jgi:hypothetical protein
MEAKTLSGSVLWRMRQASRLTRPLVRPRVLREHGEYELQKHLATKPTDRSFDSKSCLNVNA